MVGRIKLAWWREALEALDRTPAPAEPLLQKLQADVLPRGVDGAELARMEEGWVLLLSDAPLTNEELDAHARLRGGVLFRASARLLGGAAVGVEQAGEIWALADLARHSGDAQDQASAIAAAGEREGPERWPVALRPLGMLFALARRDLEQKRPRWETQGSPRRMVRMLRLRLTGR